MIRSRLSNNRLIAIFFVINAVFMLFLLYYSPRSSCIEAIKYVSSQSDEDYRRNHKDIINIPHQYGTRINVFNQIWNGVWWREKLPTYELDMFFYLNTFLHESTNYIGIGEWIGPTLLFAAKRANKVVGAEPDHFAYAELRRNVDANPSIASKITLSKMCISDKAESATMFGSGKNGSFLSKVNSFEHHEYQKKYPKEHWPVYCTPLWAFCENYEAMSNDMFIKLDTQGAEQFIFPSLFPWLSNFTVKTGIYYKPAFFLILRDTSAYPGDTLDKVLESIRLYNWVSIVGPKIQFQKGKDFPRSAIADSMRKDLFLTDRQPIMD